MSCLKCFIVVVSDSDTVRQSGCQGHCEVGTQECHKIEKWKNKQPQAIKSEEEYVIVGVAQ